MITLLGSGPMRPTRGANPGSLGHGPGLHWASLTEGRGPEGEAPGAEPVGGETRGPQPGPAPRPRSPADGAVSASPVQPRWLFIVHAGETALYGRLATRLAGVARVVLDQRRGDRRRGRASVGSDRRRGDRRRPLPSGVTLARG